MARSRTNEVRGSNASRRTDKPSGKPAEGPRPVKGAKKPAWHVSVRMYRKFLGDCFLVSLTQQDGSLFHIVIDCGVILGTPDASGIMKKVVDNLKEATGGCVDLLVVTHEHWDHVSGFTQARDQWGKLKVKEVWLPWTEDENDPLARKLVGERRAMCAALAQAAARLGVMGEQAVAEEVHGLLDYFGAAGSNSTRAALDFVKTLSGNVRYCRPKDDPQEIPGTGTRIYVLGPPPDEALIKKIDPSTKAPETYGMDGPPPMPLLLGVAAEAWAQPAADGIFESFFQIPMAVAQQMPFFQTRYWGPDADSDEKDQGWRRIDQSWLESSSTMALALDSATNNTSLVLAIELPGREVLIFAADAQVGNWLSWPKLSWKVNDQTVTGADLLQRTVFYKVGHHGSHNATLRAQGLEEMKKLQMAFLPVDQDEAQKKKWNLMPFEPLLQRMDQITGDRVVRSDRDVPLNLKTRVVDDSLYYEVMF